MRDSAEFLHIDLQTAVAGYAHYGPAIIGEARADRCRQRISHRDVVERAEHLLTAANAQALKSLDGVSAAVDNNDGVISEFVRQRFKKDVRVHGAGAVAPRWIDGGIFLT